jgi:2,5-dioxopentanoate dehydrogenase
MNLSGKNIIGNLLAGDGQTFQAENPARAIKIDPLFHEATLNEINMAIEKAQIAFQELRHKTGNHKAIFLEAIAEEILAMGDNLIHRCMQETGLPEARLIGERGRTIGQLKLFAQTIREGSWVNARLDLADADRKPLPKPDVRSMLRPLGPVGIFGASNFPFAFSVAGGDTVSALAAGCPVVFKGHPAHPGTCELVGMAIQKAAMRCEMPEGTFSMLQGRSTDVGLAIVKHPFITAIGFTGSFRGGKAIFDEACRRPVPIPVYAEMGSTNPVFVLPWAAKIKSDSITTDLASSVTQGVGQFCTNPGLVFIQQSEEGNVFKRLLAKNIAAAASGVMLTSAIHNNFETGLERLRQIRGVTSHTGGKVEGDGYRAAASFFEASADSFLKERALEEEVFGPSTVLILADSRAELLQAAEKLTGHLTATVHGTEKDLNDYADLISILEQKVGRVVINGYPTGVEVCHSMVHGGPFPATTDSRTTSVGTAAILRFARPVCYQNYPAALLPDELRDHNPLNIWRMVNGEWKRN